jgi:hypothetical protein
MYADPGRGVYTHLGMTIRNLNGAAKGEQKKSYLPTNIALNTLGSIVVRPYLVLIYFMTIIYHRWAYAGGNEAAY